MDFEHLRDEWAGQPLRRDAPSDEELIRQAVRRDRALQRKVLVRDAVELLTALAVAIGLLWKARAAAVGWPWGLAAVITLGVAGVFARERLRRPPSPAQATDVRGALQRALVEVDHQVRLLTSVLWWYLAPFGLVVTLIMVGSVLDARTEMGPEAWARARPTFAWVVTSALFVAGAFYWLIWRANQRAVRRNLGPHREEILRAIRRLSNDEQERP
jgi:hypothetical protein